MYYLEDNLPLNLLKTNNKKKLYLINTTYIKIIIFL